MKMFFPIQLLIWKSRFSLFTTTKNQSLKICNIVSKIRKISFIFSPDLLGLSFASLSLVYFSPDNKYLCQALITSGTG
jgi:hypothetical protein